MPRYRAFVSYRHIDPDRNVAIWFHKALERYRIPRLLRKRGSNRRLGTVFRDEEELHTTADLTETIRAALRESDYLIVVCSPRSAESKWVNAEIRHFRELGRGDRILPLLIEGTPATSFPAALLESESESESDAAEPLAADIRPLPQPLRRKLRPLRRLPRTLFEHWLQRRDDRKRRKIALLRLLAPPLECRFDDLYQRDARRRRQRRRVVATAAAVMLFAGGTMYHNALQAEIFELTTYSRDSLGFDPSRSVLLSSIAFDKSNSWLGLGGPVVRQTLETAVYRSRLVLQLDMPSRPVQALAWHASGIIAAGDDSGAVVIWDRAKGTMVKKQPFETGIQKIEFRPGNDILQAAVVTGSVSRLSGFSGVTMMRLGDARRVHFWDLQKGPNTPVTLLRSTHLVSPADVSWCSDGRHVAASAGTERILIWNLSRSNQPLTVPVPEFTQAIKWAYSCSELYVGTARGLKKWTEGSTELVAVGSRCGEENPDTINASSTIAEGVVALDVRGKQVPGTFDTIEDVIATGGHAGVVRVGSGSDVQPLSGHTNTITAVSWNHRGTRIATASLDGTVRIWSIPDHSQQYHSEYAFYTNHGQTWALAWSPDDLELATTGDDGKVRVWSVAGAPQKRGGKRTGTLRLNNDGVLLLDDQPVSDAELRELIRERRVRPLTDEECSAYLRGSSCRQ